MKAEIWLEPWGLNPIHQGTERRFKQEVKLGEKNFFGNTITVKLGVGNFRLSNPQDLCDQFLLLDMIFLDNPHFCAGVRNISIETSRMMRHPYAKLSNVWGKTSAMYFCS